MKNLLLIFAMALASFTGTAQAVETQLEFFELSRIDAVVDQHISCYGNADGTIVVTGIPDTVRYDYYVKRGTEVRASQSGTFLGLRPGKYKVWAQSVLGVTKSIELEVTSPRKLRPVVVVDKYPTQDVPGALSLDVQGGMAELQPFLISWWYSPTKTGQKVLLNNDPNDNFKNFLDPAYPGYYAFIVEDDNGCFATIPYLFRRKN
jgi:hypothetical protein